MRFGLLLMLMVLLGEAQGQFIAPYNPDSNQDSAIGSADLIDFLAFFGYDFLPPAIEIEGEDVLSTLINLTEQMSALQQQINLMQSEMMTKDSVLRLTWLRDLSQVDLEGASLVDTDLSRVNFSHANMQGAQLMNSSFNDALMDGTNLSGANLLNGDFDSAILSNADLSGANLQYA
ncbi:MAG: pentapeptide repeat-containing protein, partial [Flavobacteriales bacterium]